MGLTHSVPVPSNADFLVPHKPLPVPPLFADTESYDSPDSSSEAHENEAEYSFFVPKDAWSNGASLYLTPLSDEAKEKHRTENESKQDSEEEKDNEHPHHHHHHHPHHKIIKIVPVPDKDYQQCLITNATGTVLAVLQIQKYQCIQICTLNNHSGGSTATPVVVGSFKGQPLYEYAIVTEDYQKHDFHHKLTLSAAAETSATYQMAQCGPKWFGRPMGIVVQCHQSNADDPTAADDSDKSKKPKDTIVGAYLTHQNPHKTWGCRAAPGVDPVLLAAFVVCSDKQRTMFNEKLEQKSGVMSSKVSNAMPKDSASVIHTL